MLKRINRSLLNFFSNPDINKLFLLLVGVTVSLWLFIREVEPLLYAVLIAYLLEDIVIRMTTGRWRISRRAAAAAVVVMTVVFVTLAVYGLPRFLLELRELGDKLPQTAVAFQTVIERINTYLPAEVALDKHIATDKISEGVATFAQYLLDNTLSFAGNIFSFLLYAVLLPLLVFFMLKDKEIITAYSRRFFVPTPSLQRLWSDIDEEFGAYIRGKFIEAGVIGVASWLVFLFFKMDHAFALATLVGLSVFIPFVGAITVTFPVVLFAYLQFGWGQDFALIVTLYGVIQAFDGQVLVPLLFSEIVKIHPVALLAAIVFFGNFWGLWGVFFAIPLAVIIKHVFVFVENQLKEAD